jgi:FMN reductase
MIVVGIGGTQRPGSSSEMALRAALAAAHDEGAEIACFSGPRIELPLYNPAHPERSSSARGLIEAVRAADGLVLASPGYHGTVSGLVKNALDYVEDTAGDDRPYLDGLPVGCIAVASGWQAAVNTLRTLRDIVHSLRGIPTGYGAALNSSIPLFAEGACADEAVLESLNRIGAQVATMGRRLMAETR